MQISELYEPMLSREVEGIREVVRRFGARHGPEALFQAVARFALLAASPSQHGKHALVACVAAKEIEAEAGERFDELLTECAIYAAQSRLPWSEPPITDPPPVEEDHPSALDEIRAAIRARDRLRGEKWLAARIRKGAIARDFFAIAAEDLSDFGHKLIVAVAVWKLAPMLQRPASYPFLRVAVGEWTGYFEEPPRLPSTLESRERLIHALVRKLVADKGALESFHHLALMDAAMEAATLSGDDSVEQRVRRFLSMQLSDEASQSIPQQTPELPIYPLARDYAEYLKAFPISRRLERFTDRTAILAAAKYNRDHAPSFEEWSFA